MTPLYVGQVHGAALSWNKSDSACASAAGCHKAVGGLVEPFAFGGGAPLDGLGNATSAVLNVPARSAADLPNFGFSLANATYAPLAGLRFRGRLPSADDSALTRMRSIPRYAVATQRHCVRNRFASSFFYGEVIAGISFPGLNSELGMPVRY